MGVGQVPIKKHTELTDKEVAGVIDHAAASVTTEKLVDAILSADAAGRAKMAADFLQLSHMPDAFFPATADARAKFADLFLTNAKIAAGTIDLLTKGTYVPVNKAGDTMTGDLTLQDTKKLLLNTAGTLGLYTDPTNFGSDVLILASAIKNLVSPAGLAIYANAGEDGLGDWAPYVYFRADGHLQLIAAAGKEIQTSGDIVMGSNNLTIGAGYTVDGVDVSTHDHSGVAGHGPVLDGALCLNNIDLVLGTGGITSSKTVTRHGTIHSLELGRPPANFPAVAIYGITGALEFTVGTDKAYYVFHLPTDWASGTDLLFHFHWTRSTTGGNDSTKTAKWQLKYLAINGQSENCNSGEATLSVQDTYDSAVLAEQVVYESGDVTIPAASLAARDLVILEVMAIAPTGTALAEPALVGIGFSYTAYQVIPA